MRFEMDNDPNDNKTITLPKQKALCLSFVSSITLSPLLLLSISLPSSSLGLSRPSYTIAQEYMGTWGEAR